MLPTASTASACCSAAAGRVPVGVDDGREPAGGISSGGAVGGSRAWTAVVVQCGAAKCGALHLHVGDAGRQGEGGQGRQGCGQARLRPSKFHPRITFQQDELRYDSSFPVVPTPWPGMPSMAGSA